MPVTFLRVVLLCGLAVSTACASTEPLGPDREVGGGGRNPGRDVSGRDDDAADVGSPDAVDDAVVPESDAPVGSDTVADTEDVADESDVAEPEDADAIDDGDTDVSEGDASGSVECTPANAIAKCGSAEACVDGYCCDRACGGDCEACNVAGLEGTCSPLAATVVCRAAGGQCDSAEYCTGTSGICPADTKAPAGTSCGSASDSECDNPDICDGAGNCSPNVEPAGRACGSSASSTCDLPDRCNGLGACSANHEPTTTICRAAAGACDAAERCDGAGSCPADLPAAVGTPCGSNADTACTDPDTCNASGVCVPNHASDGGSCGPTVTQFRCSGTGCSAQPQSASVPQVCSSGECVAGTAGAWTTIDTCTANEICVSGPSSAACDLCDTPPAEYCLGGDAFYFEATPGTCSSGTCSYAPLTEDCAGSCSIVGGDAVCVSCNEAIMSVVGAPLWSWESGNEGWDMAGFWERDDYDSRTGNWAMDAYDSFDYLDNEFDRTAWSASYDFTQCVGCAVNVSFFLRGSTESCCDGVTLQCSGNGGSSWTSVGDEIRGSYSNWTSFTRALPASCLTSTMRLGLLFDTDFSIVDYGFVIDDLRLHTTAIAPNGFLDSASASGLGGWTCDGDTNATSIDVRLEFYRNGTGTPIVRTVRADGDRPDLVTARECGSTANHGYTFTYDEALLSALGAGTHTVRAFGLDAPQPCGAGEYELSGSPKTFVR